MPRTPKDIQGSPTEQAAHLGVRDRIVALGHGLRSATPGARESQALMLIELAGHRGDSDAASSGARAILRRLPARWRERHAEDALRVLARSWGVIPEGARPLALALGRDRWLHVARELAQDPDPGARCSVLELAMDVPDPGLGKVVCRLLRDEEQRVRQQADAAVLRLALDLIRSVPAEVLGTHYATIAKRPALRFQVDPQVINLERAVLLGAIADAAWGFAAHRCRSALIAALLLMEHPWPARMERQIGARMRRLLSERNHPSHAPLRAALRRTDCPLLRERALRWLPIGAISNAALERLRGADSPMEHALVLNHGALAMRPLRADRLPALGGTRLGTSSDGVLPPPDQWGGFDAPQRAEILRLDALMGEDEPTRRERTEPALSDPSGSVRMRAVGLCPAQDLRDYLFDPDAPVASHAALRWATLGEQPPRLNAPASIERLRLADLAARSPHPAVRALGAQERARLSIDDPSSPASRLCARRAYQRDPSGLVRSLRDRLAIQSSSAQTITLIRALGIESRFELDLIGLAQDTHADPRARSGAIAALSRVSTNAARYVVSEALSASDDRMRANAVALCPAPPSAILERCDDAHHRVRANAVRRLLVSRDGSATSAVAKGTPSSEVAHAASGALIELLGDPRPMHRLAGTWVAQRAVRLGRRDVLGGRWAPIIAQLEEISATDEHEPARSRASRCIARLGRELRADASRARSGGAYAR